SPISVSMSRNPSTTAPSYAAHDIVSFTDVSLRYGQGPEVLRQLSFALKPGSFHFVTGPSGAGKTSLLKLVYMAARPTGGSIRLFGEDLAKTTPATRPALRRRLGVVFQDLLLLEHLS